MCQPFLLVCGPTSVKHSLGQIQGLRSSLGMTRIPPHCGQPRLPLLPLLMIQTHTHDSSSSVQKFDLWHFLRKDMSI